MTNFEQMINSINEADKVLIGIGKDVEADYNIILKNSGIDISTISDNLKGYYHKYALNNIADEEIRKRELFYQKIKEIIGEKDYYILSLSMDDIIYKAFAEDDNVVTPCGGLRKLQPDTNLGENIIVDCESYIENVMGIIKKGNVLTSEDIPEFSGVKLVFNNMYASDYNEEGYIPKFTEYKKWLQTTINKKLCIIELGADLKFPSVIRFAFEKLAYYNQKSSFYRINSSFYQLTPETKDRGVSIKDDPIDFILR